MMEVLRYLGMRFSSEEEAPVNLEGEYLYQAYLSIQRLADTLKEYSQGRVSIALFFRLLNQYLQRVSIPFEGEPLTGLQVMGFWKPVFLISKKWFCFR